MSGSDSPTFFHGQPWSSWIERIGRDKPLSKCAQSVHRDAAAARPRPQPRRRRASEARVPNLTSTLLCPVAGSADGSATHARARARLIAGGYVEGGVMCYVSSINIQWHGGNTLPIFSCAPRAPPSPPSSHNDFQDTDNYVIRASVDHFTRIKRSADRLLID